jgi:hypothetical protein
MSFSDSPTERTTALTDVMVFLVALLAIGYMGMTPDADPDKICIWIVAFGLIAIASLLGAIAHGIVFSEKINGRIWHGLNLCLGLAVSMFVVGVVYDLAGIAKAHRMLPIMVGAGALFFLITWRFPGIFILFIIYEAVALLFALGVYGWLTFAAKSPGAVWMTAGVSTSLVAAIVQAVHRIRVEVIWPFDHNGLFHVIQCAGLLLLLRGILS